MPRKPKADYTSPPPSSSSLLHMITLVAQREPRQRHQTGFFTAGAAPPPRLLHAAARRAQAEEDSANLSDEDSAAPELYQHDAIAEGAAPASGEPVSLLDGDLSSDAAADERRHDGDDGEFTYAEFVAYYGAAEGRAAWRASGELEGSSEAALTAAITPIHTAGALRLASPKPRVHPRGGLEALEERWRAAAEPEELVSLARRIEATVVPHHLYTGSRGIMSVLRQWGRCASSPAVPVGRHASSPTTGGLAPTARIAPKRPRPAALRPWSPVAARSASSSSDPFAFTPSELPDDDRAQARCSRGSGRKRRSMRPARGHVDYRGQLYDLESD